MTAEQERDYLTNPDHCPWCNSKNIVAEPCETYGDRQTVFCEDCSKKWMDIYETIVLAIQEIE